MSWVVAGVYPNVVIVGWGSEDVEAHTSETSVAVVQAVNVTCPGYGKSLDTVLLPYLWRLALAPPGSIFPGSQP